MWLINMLEYHIKESTSLPSLLNLNKRQMNKTLGSLIKTADGKYLGNGAAAWIVDADLPFSNFFPTPIIIGEEPMRDENCIVYFSAMNCQSECDRMNKLREVQTPKISNLL
jgi:hypothetical protein